MPHVARQVFFIERLEVIAARDALRDLPHIGSIEQFAQLVHLDEPILGTFTHDRPFVQLLRHNAVGRQPLPEAAKRTTILS